MYHSLMDTLNGLVLAAAGYALYRVLMRRFCQPWPRLISGQRWPLPGIVGGLLPPDLFTRDGDDPPRWWSALGPT